MPLVMTPLREYLDAKGCDQKALRPAMAAKIKGCRHVMQVLREATTEDRMDAAIELLIVCPKVTHKFCGEADRYLRLDNAMFVLTQALAKILEKD